MIECSSKVTYIYSLCDSDGSVRYVGKADLLQRRFWSHLNDKADTHKGRWLKQLRAKGEKPHLRILQCVRFDLWQAAEIFWIEKFKADGAELTNSTGGGIGPLCPSPETRAKMSAAKIGWKQSDDLCARRSAWLTGRKRPPRSQEWIDKITIARKQSKNYVITDAMKAKQRLANRMRPVTAKSGYRGVYFSEKRNAFRAYICLPDTRKTKGTVNKVLGSFKTAEEAAKAFNDEAVKHGWPKEGLNKI